MHLRGIYWPDMIHFDVSVSVLLQYGGSAEIVHAMIPLEF